MLVGRPVVLHTEACCDLPVRVVWQESATD